MSNNGHDIINQPVIEKVVAYVRELVPGSTVTAETTLEQVSFDSLDQVELAMFLEQEYSIELKDEVLERWQPTTTLGEIAAAAAAGGAK